ncbi:unnamed protein product [Didymodactylos carnosus]|uniref:Arrestin C-terminal-like domain-containing protein n=1 Tax=Didymodactylos carnosus TaxID=1234261 RepID=A0A8S2P7V5_9BILA|nr:unnamed protein product [Didymodactylos carnosus]CAF4041089.1 unnamed protein product [Didymodactylos carnosus]
MGNSESNSVNVTFDRPTLFYFAGEVVSGTIHFQNVTERLKIDEIYLTTTGEIGYTTQEKRVFYRDGWDSQQPGQQHHNYQNRGNARTETYTEYHRIPFFQFRLPVMRPTNGQTEIILNRGQHRWPFEVQLPTYLPPSVSVPLHSYPYVKYFMQVVIDKPWYQPNSKQIYSLTLSPRVNLQQIPNSYQPMQFNNHNRKDVVLQGALSRSALVPGQILNSTIEIQNPKRATIKRIEVSLLQHIHIATNNRTDNIFRIDIPRIQEFNSERLTETFSIMIPNKYLAPTSTYHYNGIIVSVNYELKFDVKARGLFTDFTICLPITMGTEPSPEQEQQLNRRDVYIPPAAPPSYPHQSDYNNQYSMPEDLPPSYESVVGTGKI